jgi:hypothetical protein
MSNSYDESYINIIKRQNESIQELVDLNDDLADKSISLDVWDANNSKQVGPTNSTSQSKELLEEGNSPMAKGSMHDGILVFEQLLTPI